MLDEVTVPRLVIAGLSSGTGKTTIALGLVSALRRRGRTVQTFKVGPDFVDVAYLSHASGRPCRNLDAWMLGQDGVRASLAHGTSGADCVVIEGTRGLFDGHGVSVEARPQQSYPFPGSSAEVARLTSAPVVLVIDVETTGETAAALALGVKQLDPSLNICGVILNNVPGEYRRRVVEDVIWDWATLPVLGAVPLMSGVRIPELRTGLLPLTENHHVDPALEEMAAAIERHCNLDLIERLMSKAGPVRTPAAKRPAPVDQPVRIGVAFDDAFCFYYAENLELLEQAGAVVVPFSPLEDRALPRDLDAIYLGGGVSEMYIPRLAGNRSIMESLRRANAQGVPIYAECGGLLYGARQVELSDGSHHEMAGIVPVDMIVEAGTLSTGYRDLRLARDTILGPVGTRLRGHEFHYSRIVGGSECLQPAYSMHDADGEPLGCEGWSTDTMVASLVHLHFGQNPRIVEGLCGRARDYGRTRRLQTSPA